ncbi:MAG: hypothetical protein ACLR0U_07950 [Enterocloster clostridioformis]
MEMVRNTWKKLFRYLFEIPAPSMENIHNAFFSKLNAVLGDIREERWDKTTWAELFQFGLKKYIKSIRRCDPLYKCFFIEV